MKTSVILGVLLLASCASAPCHKDLSKALSSCPVAVPMSPQGQWVTVSCGFSKVQVRTEDFVSVSHHCECLNPMKKGSKICR